MRKIALLFVSVICSVTVSAQEATVPPTTTTIDQGKEINDIKRSEQAVYADVMEFVAPETEGVPTLAQQRSQQMLQAHVIEIFAKRMKMDKKDVQEIWDVIDDKCQNIVIRKGDICRVFTYIMKDALGLARKKPKKGDVEKYLTPDEPATTVAETTEQEAQDMSQQLAGIMTNGQDSIDNITTAQAVTAQAAPTEQTVPAQATVQATVPVQQSAEPVQQATQVEAAPIQTTVQAAVPAVQPVPTTEPVQTAVPETPTVIEVPQLAQNMLNQANMTELLRFLLKEKNRQTLMYGSLSNMTNLESCYVVIINKTAKKVVTVLGPGKEQRINYVTSKYDTIANYKGGNHQAIVVQEY